MSIPRYRLGVRLTGRWVAGTGRPLRALLLSQFVGQRLRGLLAIVRTADLESLRELIEAGKVTPAVDRTYPLSAAAEAVEQMRNGNVRGKLVLTV